METATTTPTVETAGKSSNQKGAKTVAKRPTMAARKPFELPPIQVVDEVPVPVRSNAGQRMPMGFDELLEFSKQHKGKPAMRLVPMEFWTAWGTPAETNTPSKIKDRIRRSFYGWQGDDKEKLKYTLAFSDQFDKKQNYTGVNVYLTLKP